MDSSVQVLVIQGILIVPDPRTGIGHFVSHKPEAIIARIRLDLVHCCASERLPSVNGGFHAHGGAGRRKCIVIPAATDIKPAIRGVIVHVALPGMTLAPNVFMWSQILTFGKISRARVLRRV